MPGRRKVTGFACALVGAGGCLLQGCQGRQSALEPAGRGAEQLAELFWWMTAGSVIVWVAVVALTAYAIGARHDAPAERRATALIIGGGVVVPTLVLAGLLAYGLALLPSLLAPAPAGALKIAVSGEQWWWRVRYLDSGGGEPVELANEVRLPVGEPVEFELTSPDVIHSFWIPALGGKVDMLPGRKNRLRLEPTRTGIFRGVCAEYCGTAHALMAFDVVVMEKADFDEWLAAQREPAREPTDALAITGRERFQANGCSACHAVRGTAARGVIGPDLTHLGGRRTLGAGIMPNDRAALVQWLQRLDQVKPGVLMPHYRMLPPAETDALAAYLESLQ